MSFILTFIAFIAWLIFGATLFEQLSSCELSTTLFYVYIALMAIGFLYCCIHIVLFLFLSNIQRQLASMSILELRQLNIHHDILPEIHDEMELRMTDSQILYSVFKANYAIHEEKKDPLVINLNKETENNGTRCMICLVEFENDDIIYNLDCKHPFHYDCLEKWYRRSSHCPLCKKQIKGVKTDKCIGRSAIAEKEHEVKVETKKEDHPVEIEMTTVEHQT